MSAIQSTLWRRLIYPERPRLISFALSLALGVSALFGVSQLLSAVSERLKRDARAELGGDLSLTSWRPLEADPWYQETREELSARGELIEGVEMASMATIADQPPQLIALKGVAPGYPLTGALTWRSPPLSARLALGEAWVARRLAEQHGLERGSSLIIAGERLTVTGVIEREPDAGIAGSLSFAPRVMVSRETAERLKLIQQGSRVRRVSQWRRCARSPCSGGGEPITSEPELKAFSEALIEAAPEHIEVRAQGSSQPQLLTIFERVSLFFSMIGLVTLSLSTMSFISGLLGLLRDQLPQMGALRSLGVHPGELKRLYGKVTLLLGALGGGLGVLLGLGLYSALSSIAEPWLGVQEGLSLHPDQALGAVALAVWVSALVNMGAQRALGRASTQALWRAPDPELKLTRAEQLALSAALMGSLWLYLYLLSGSAALALAFVSALAALTLSSGLIIWLLFAGLSSLRRALRSSPRPALRFALGHLLGYRGRAWTALLSLSVGFSLIAALQGVQGSLERALDLRDQAPPQLFMVDVQDDQVTTLQRLVSEHHATGFEALPLTRARISAIRGDRVQRAQLDEGSVAGKMRARTLTREHNITTRVTLSSAERVTEGRWWSPEEAARAELTYLSLEERLAGRLGVKVGDQLTFDIQGVELSFTVLNLRRVDWLSMRPNFLIVASPGALEGAPRTHVASAQLSGEGALSSLSAACAQALPNVSLIDARPILQRGRHLLQTLNVALTLTGGLCALAGALLLIGGVMRDRRRRGDAVSRLSALGLSRARAWRWVTLELSLLGGLSTLVIALCSWALMWGATRALQLPLDPDSARLTLWLIISGTLAPVVAWLSPREREPS